MKESETTNENVIQQLSSDEKQSRESPNTTSKGTIAVEEKYGTIKFERRLKHPREMVWKAIADQEEIFRWLPDYKETFGGYKGGRFDLLDVVSGSHVTGNILVCDLHRVLEHEWFIDPNQMFTKGEPESVIRRELKQNGDSDTLLL